MPNLRGASPVSFDGQGRLYAALMVSRGRPNRRRHGRGKILNTKVMMAYASGGRRQGRVGTLVGGHTGAQVGRAGKARAGVRAGSARSRARHAG